MKKKYSLKALVTLSLIMLFLMTLGSCTPQRSVVRNSYHPKKSMQKRNKVKKRTYSGDLTKFNCRKR